MKRGGARGWAPIGLALILAAQLSQAQASGQEGSVGRSEVARDATVEARLLIHPDDRENSRMRVGVLFELPAGWHMYGRDPGDTGLPTEIEWRVPAGEVEPIVWPEPSRYEESDGLFTTYGYAEQVLLASAVRFRDPAPDSAPAERRIGVEVDLLVCESACVPLHFSLDQELDSSGPPQANAFESGQIAALFAQYAVPAQRVSAPGNSESPETLGGMESIDAGEIISGREGPGHSPELGLLLALLLAFVGGLVLNLMPCVLPVLAIKVFGLAELAHEERSVQVRNSLAYALGVEVSLGLLALGVIALRAAGTSVGWGFQLQEPLFVAMMCAVLVIFAMNLFGAFEFTVNTGGLASIGADATGLRRSFFEGLLVVVLATPCSAPFLGTAVGFAFANSGAVVLSIFVTIGAGLSAPFLLVSCNPALSRFVPRGGAWMLKLRAVLGFSLLASGVWLLWVFGRGTGADGMAALAALLLATAFAAQAFGWAQRAGHAGFAHALGFGSAALLLVGFNSVSVAPTEIPAQEGSVARSWRPFFEDAVAEALGEGRPVLVSFTADWCITCKVNERVVLENDVIRDTIESLDVATFKADWTRRDERIRAALARFGRAGVPLIVVYSPDEPDRPHPLPDLISVDSLLGALRAAGPAFPARASALPFAASALDAAPVTDVTRL